MEQILNEENEVSRAADVQGTLEQNGVLRTVLTDLVRATGGKNIKEDDIQILIMRNTEEENIPISTIYYAGCFADDLNITLNDLREPGMTVKELSCFADIDRKECVLCKTKEYMIQCLLLNEVADYYGLLQFILDEITKEAGYRELTVKNLLYAVMKKSNLDNRAILMEKYTHNFLVNNTMPAEDLLIELSAQRYEGSESEARIYIDAECMKNKYKVFEFDSTGDNDRKLESGKLRTIRKLMEISKRNALQLLADRDMCIVGLVSVDQEELEEIDRLCNYICFSGYMQWSVYIKGKEEICYKQGKYFINSSESRDIYERKVNEFREKIGTKISADIISKVEHLVGILKEQRHGTTVILTDDKEETERLCEVGRGMLVAVENQQGLLMEDNNFDREKLLSITGIDGALFMNMQGQCTAMGVIVDGVAKVRGDTGRGARYNSIYNYIYQKGMESGADGKIYVALIFSEDGGVDIIDNLTRLEE